MEDSPKASLTFVGPRAVMSYYVSDQKSGRIGCRFRSLPVSWFYQGGVQSPLRGHGVNVR